MQQLEEQNKVPFRSVVIPDEEWHERSKQIKISKDEMNKLIMNFFIFEGYREAAVQFQKETQQEISDNELDSMSDRIEVKKFILNGQIDQAVQKLNSINSEMLQQDVNSAFNLNLQKMIELIKLNKIDDAILFGQTDLLPLLEKEPSLIEQVEKAMTLLAFEDTSICPVKDLVDYSQRLKVSSQINKQLLMHQDSNQDAKISTLMKLLIYSQNQLSQQVVYPELIDIAKGQFKNREKEIEEIKPSEEID